MPKINCREMNMCMFCECWLGQRPVINLLTGDVKAKPGKGLCSLDNTNQEYNPDGLCYRFKKIFCIFEYY